MTTVPDRATVPFEAVLRHVADGITIQSADEQLMFANEAAAQLAGVSSAEELVRTPPRVLLERLSIVGPDGAPFPWERLPGRRALEGEEGAEETIGYHFRATGETRWSLVRASPLRDDAGRVVAAINVFHDITAHHRAEERIHFLAEAGDLLAESLDYDRTLARVARLAVPRVADWCMVYMEEPDGRIERLAIEHAGGLHGGVLEQLRPFEFDPDAALGVPHVLRTGEPELHAHADSRLVASDVKDAEPLAAELEGLGITSWMCVPLSARGRTFGVISLVAAESGRHFDEGDLTLAVMLARRAALAVDNARLHRQVASRAAAAEALELIAEGVALLDAGGVVRLWNPAATDITGVAEEAAVGRRPEDVVPGWARLASDASSNGRPQTVPLEISGREAWLAVTRISSPAGSLVTFRDVTDDRAIEKLRSDFVSTVSHELRTPLAAIYGAAQTLNRDDLPENASQQETLLDMICVESERLARTVDDILWASRLESETMHVEIQTCDAVPIVRGVVRSATVHAPPGITLGLQLGEDALPVTATPTRCARCSRTSSRTPSSTRPTAAQSRSASTGHPAWCASSCATAGSAFPTPSASASGRSSTASTPTSPAGWAGPVWASTSAASSWAAWTGGYGSSPARAAVRPSRSSCRRRSRLSAQRTSGGGGGGHAPAEDREVATAQRPCTRPARVTDRPGGLARAGRFPSGPARAGPPTARSAHHLR